MKLIKCQFYAKETQYFGHVLRTTGIKPLLSKMTTIKLMKPFKNTKHKEYFLALLVTTAVHQEIYLNNKTPHSPYSS